MKNKECFECGKPATEEHHVIPQSLGGTKTVPLCGRCHSAVHGLGGRRDNIKELTTRGLNKKMAFDFHYVWWHYFKCAESEDSKTIEELSADLEISVWAVKNRIKRLESMDADFLEELVLPYTGYEYKGASIFNLDRFDITSNDVLLIESNREEISKSVEKELGITT